MRTKHLFYTLAMAATLAACSQEEIVNSPVAQQGVKGSFANYVGEVYNGGITITKDGDVESRMAIANGTPSWVDGDKVGLVWTNPEAYGNENYGWKAWPTTSMIYSNTRMTYDASTKDFFMTDGQVFKGMYFAYYPFNEAIQNVQQFKVAQAQSYEQTNSTTETLNKVATDLVWMSQRYEDNEEVMTDATFLYPLTEDNVESGVATGVNILMKPFSNILDARFVVVDKKAADKTQLDPKVVVVKEVILGSRLSSGGAEGATEFGGVANIPTTAAFDLSKWGSDEDNFGIPSSGQSGLDGRKLTVNSSDSTATGFYSGENKVGSISVTFANEAENAGKTQRVNFMFLPHAKSTFANQVYEIKVVTDYGYAIIPESAWYKSATNQGGLWVNTNGSAASTVGLTASYLLKNLTDRIGMQAVRGFDLDIADLIYNDLKVNSTETLCEVLDKWNKLGKSGELRVWVEENNNFADFDWAADSKYPEIVEFLADSGNKLVVNAVDANYDMNLTGETHIADTAFDQLHIAYPRVEQEDGKMTVEGEETFIGLNIDEDAELLIPANATVNGGQFVLEGETLIETDGELNATILITNSGSLELQQNGEMKITGTGIIANIQNTGEIVTNGDITSPKIENNGDFRIKTHSNTEATSFINKGNVYYDEQGECSKITNKYDEGGRIIATVLEGTAANTLADYIVAANTFKCTDLVINKNDFFTTEQWDNSLYAKPLTSFKNVKMNDGVEIVFTKGLNMKNATVTIAENAVVTWSKGVNVETPVYTINGVIVEAGATLNVSDITVENKVDTKVKIGGGLTTTIDGIVCFSNQTTKTITAEDGTSGTINVK